MNVNENGGSHSSVSFSELLTLLLIGLRLADVIVWPWWLVLAPLLLPLGVELAAVAAIALVQAVRDAMRGR